MALSRKTLSTRPVVGAFVVVSVALLCLWSHLFSLGNKAISFGSGLPVVSVVMLWSWYEILGLRRKRFGKRGMRIYLLLAFVFTLVPPFILLCHSDGDKVGDVSVGYALLALLVEVGLVCVWGRVLNRGVTWLECREFFRGKSFVFLVLGSLLFWNVILFMVVGSMWHWMVFVFVVVFLNDTMAYVMGKMFGKRRCFRYSPNKTLEGLLLGMGVTYLVIVLFWCLIPSGARSSLVGGTSYWWPVLLLCVPLLGLCNLGDLQFSMHKRMFGIKDYSRILGSHGGFWDRFDSHCFAFVFWGVCAFVWHSAIQLT